MSVFPHPNAAPGLLPQCPPELVSALVGASHDLVGVMTTEGEYVALNERHARTLLGVPAEAARARTIRDFYTEAMCIEGVSRARRIVAERKPTREILMLRGMYMTNTMIPVHLTGIGPVLLTLTSTADPVRHSLMQLVDGLSPGEDATSYFPLADLGPMASLSQRQLMVLRALALGCSLAEIARGMRLGPSQLRDMLDAIDQRLGWGDERGLRTHAYAAGLHLFEDWYFQTVVLDGLPAED